jgi:hypothetical protein
MKLYRKNVLYGFVYGFMLLFLWTSCGDSEQITPIIDIPINKIIDLNSLSYQRLKFNNGFVYETGGLRGLIIYRKDATTYYVYDRACTYRINNSCEVIEADGSGFFLTDPCCGSRFDWEGQPTSGVARANLVRYRTSLSGSLLYINN